MNIRKVLWILFHSKFGKLLPVLLIAGMMATASASVYVFYYGNVTATVKSPDVRLYAGSDASGSCTAYPCATVSVTSTYDVATISLSIFPASANTPYPATYYTNITTIRNVGTSPHSIKSIQIFNIASTSSSDFGNITVYYCTTQTEFDANGKLATPSNCVGSYSITSTTSGSISGTFPQSIAASTTQYIEIVGYAGSGATTADTITFTSAIQWL